MPSHPFVPPLLTLGSLGRSVPTTRPPSIAAAFAMMARQVDPATPRLFIRYPALRVINGETGEVLFEGRES